MPTTATRKHDDRPSAKERSASRRTAPGRGADGSDGTDAPQSVHMPVDVRSMSMAVVAVVAVVFMLRWAQAVFIPIALATFLRYALMPVVDWMKRRAKIPIPLGAAITLILVVGTVGLALSLLYDQTLQVLDMLPRAAQKFEQSMRRSVHEKPGAIAKLKEAAAELDKAATSATAPTNGTAPPPAPKAEPPSAKVSSYVWMGTWGAITGAGETVVVISLVYFLMVSGDTFKRKLVRISGNTLAKKRVTVQILHEIDDQIQRYLMVQVATSALLGLLCWIVFRLVGLPNAAFWGAASGVLHLVPYVGPTVAIALTGMVAYLEFSEIDKVLVVMGSALALTGTIGLGLVPWLTQRVSSVNAVTVFIALLLWGWLWGFWGLLLGVPIVMALKAVCEHIDELHPIAELLGDLPQPKESDEAPAGAAAHARS